MHLQTYLPWNNGAGASRPKHSPPMDSPGFQKSFRLTPVPGTLTSHDRHQPLDSASPPPHHSQPGSVRLNQTILQPRLDCPTPAPTCDHQPFREINYRSMTNSVNITYLRLFHTAANILSEIPHYHTSARRPTGPVLPLSARAG